MKIEKQEAKQKAARARWGERAGKSKQVRVDADAADALLTVPERERRTVASGGIRSAVKSYHALRKHEK